MHTGRSRMDAESECRVFCRYLIASDPTAYVTDAYCGSKELETESSSPVDVALLQIARPGRELWQWCGRKDVCFHDHYVIGCIGGLRSPCRESGTRPGRARSV